LLAIIIIIIIVVVVISPKGGSKRLIAKRKSEHDIESMQSVADELLCDKTASKCVKIELICNEES